MKKLFTFISILFLMASIGMAYYWMSHKPKLHPHRMHKKRQKVVHYCTIRPKAARFRLPVFFRVAAYETIAIKPRINSQIVWVNPKLYAYEPIAKGEILFKLDKSDFLIELTQARSELAQAKLELELEKKRAKRAKDELALLKAGLTKEQRSFLERKPFLEAALARYEAAKAAVQKAELQLQRTVIKAPFRLAIKTLQSGEGDVVSSATPLAQVLRLDKVIAEVPIDGRYTPFINERAKLLYKSHEGSYLGSSQWVDETSQELFVRFLFQKPLRVGAFLQGEIVADEVNGVVAVAQEYFNLDGTVWVWQEGKLHKRGLHCLWEEGGVSYCKEDALNLIKPQPYFFEGMRARGVPKCD